MSGTPGPRTAGRTADEVAELAQLFNDHAAAARRGGDRTGPARDQMFPASLRSAPGLT